jgi:LacI family transcriptional regulator
MGRNGVTITDVAKRSGVSKVTVSYVLNGRESRIKISEATKSQVIAAARELGYHPNALARGLARRRTDTLTVVMQFANVFSGWSGFINELMRGASDKACELGYDLMLHTKSQSSLDAEMAALTDGRADGALLLRDYDDPLAERLAERGFPCVQIFSHSSNPALYSVDCDNYHGGRLATEYLISLGHRRIGHIGGPDRSAAAHNRRRGYEAALAEAGLAACPQWYARIVYGGGDPTHAGTDLTPLGEIMTKPDPPTALFCWSDDVAARAIRFLRSELGKKAPEDVSVVGYDSTPLCENTLPRLSSVRQPVYDMASCGVETLVRLIHNEPISEAQIRFSPSLDMRDSCRPPASNT